MSRIRGIFFAFVALLLGLQGALGAPPSAQVLHSVGNRVVTLETGEALNARRLELILGATEFVYIKTFIINADPSEFGIYEALCDRARAGVDVRILVDDLGRRQGGNPLSRRAGVHSIESLRSCGVRFEVYSPLSWGLIDFVLYRQHDKLLVTEKGGILGGTNYSRDYSAHGQLSSRWYDLDISVEGLAACQLQKIFNDSWHRLYLEELGRLPGTGEVSDVALFSIRREALRRRFSPSTLKLGCRAHAIQAGAGVTLISGNPYFSEERPFERYLLDSTEQVIRSVENRKIRLYAPYFIPSKPIARKLIEAVKAGVEVQIITNSDTSIDPEAFEAYVAMLQRVDPLLRAGVQILLWNPSHFPASGLVKDNVFHKKGGCFGNLNCFVGSHNLDVRGDLYSTELMAVLSDPSFVSERISKFEDDFRWTVPLTREGRVARLRSSSITSLMIARIAGWAM
jgi:cardiolipin synthase